MDFEIVWTEAALADFEAAVRFIADANPTAAEELRVEMLRSVEALRQFPFMGAAYERDRRKRAREIQCRRYRIFYRVQEEEKRVEVLVIWHASRREPRLPP